MTDLVLLVNGVEYSGWTSARVTRGIEQICGAFELSVTERWADQTVRGKIRLGDACALLLSGTTLITGYVDEISPSYTAAGREVVVCGRDLTSDLVDCSAPTGQKLDQKLEALAKALCTPHGVIVRTAAGVDLSKPFKNQVAQDSESVFERLERLARLRGVLLVSDGKGAIEITRASKKILSTRLVLGKNILRGHATFSQRDVYHQYTVKAQQPEVDFPGQGTPSSKALAYDAAIRKNRKLTVLSEENADIKDCKDRALWECAVRSGRGARLNYTVQGWTHDGKEIWPINQRVHVVDEFLEEDREFLIVSAEHTLSNDGTFTDLTLCDPQAFNLLPLTEKAIFP